MPRRVKLGTHLDCGQVYCVYWNQAAAAYSSLFFFIFFLPNFQTLKFFVTLFSETLRPRRLKLGTHVDSGEMYCIYQNQVAATYLSLYYTPGIYAEGYIVLVFPFVHTYVHSVIRSYFRPIHGITSKCYVQATPVKYILPTIHQKAFIFGP